MRYFNTRLTWYSGGGSPGTLGEAHLVLWGGSLGTLGEAHLVLWGGSPGSLGVDSPGSLG